MHKTQTLTITVTMTSVLVERIPIQVIGMRLNNRGAQFINAGKYESAISTLVKALKLSERVAVSEACSCQHCNLDYCMTLGTSQPAPRLLSQETFCHNACQQQQPENVYIYERPILVSKQSMEGEHCPGVILSLIIIFNLALAHHLSAMQNNTDRKLLQKALHLYELAYQLQREEDHNGSLRFTMIVANNLGQIHRAVKNESKHQQCLEHLLSTMMYLVDSRVRLCMEFDGFLRNASKLILQDKCAGAA
jgi:tetratricopeptide (TPR) repeat protein